MQAQHRENVQTQNFETDVFGIFRTSVEEPTASGGGRCNKRYCRRRSSGGARVSIVFLGATIRWKKSTGTPRGGGGRGRGRQDVRNELFNAHVSRERTTREGRSARTLAIGTWLPPYPGGGRFLENSSRRVGEDVYRTCPSAVVSDTVHVRSGSTLYKRKITRGKKCRSKRQIIYPVVLFFTFRIYVFFFPIRLSKDLVRVTVRPNGRISLVNWHVLRTHRDRRARVHRAKAGKNNVSDKAWSWSSNRLMATRVYKRVHATGCLRNVYFGVFSPLTPLTSRRESWRSCAHSPRLRYFFDRKFIQRCSSCLLTF